MPDFSVHSYTVRLAGLLWGCKHHGAPTRAVPEPHAALLLVFAEVCGSSGVGSVLHQRNPGDLHPEGHLHLSGQNASSQKRQSNYYLAKVFLKLCYSPSYHNHL